MRRVEADGAAIRDLCRKYHITERIFSVQNKYNGMTIQKAHRLKDQKAENARRKKLLAEQLVIEGAKEIAEKMVIPTTRGQALEILKSKGLSERATSAFDGISRRKTNYMLKQPV